MCGIAISLGRPLDSKRVESVTRALRNRGPDAKGVLLTTLRSFPLTLIHTRLTIIDTSDRADQPMTFESCTLVYNGEIYNYVELRKELERVGHKFETQSDSEVVIRSYRQWGAEFVRRLEGMWAFILLDEHEQKLIISRDRFAEKPLYFMRRAGVLFFASEVKALVEMSGESLSEDRSQVSRFLVNGYRSLYKQESTFFREVQEFPRASVAEITSPEEFRPVKYWDLKFQPCEISRQDAIEQIRERLIESLRIRLRSDVPIAFCLSGGVDSTILAGIAAKHFGEKVHTFSIIDSDERYNESANIAKTVDFLGCDHSQIQISTERFWERMESLVAYHDAPVATISYYVHSLLSEEIHNHGYKVAVSGTGADELFTGYYDHYNFWLAGDSQKADIQRHLEDWNRGYGATVRNPFLKNPLSFSERPEERGHIYLDRAIFNELMLEPWAEEFFEWDYSPDLLRNRMLNELFDEVVPVILHEDDLNSMCWSVENRSPYLDSHLAELAYSLPSKHFINKGFAKSLLREAGIGFGPDSVLFDRRKRGFNASIDTLFDRQDPESRERLLSDGPIFDYVDKGKFVEFLSGDFSENSRSKFLFSFISAKMFLESDLLAHSRA